MLEEDEEFQDLLRQLHLPAEVKDNLLGLGYDSSLTFGLAFSSIQILHQNIQKLLSEGETDHSSPTCARIRALWAPCNNLHTGLSFPAAQSFPPTRMVTPSPVAPNPTKNWHEVLPPKLSIDDMESMKAQFTKSSPGEILMHTRHLPPSVRLWSLVHQQKVNKHIKYIPIQLRLSEHQYSAMIETRSSKPLRSEIQLLSQLCWNDAPELDINSVRFSCEWLNRISTFLCNAYALCNMCHLQVLKTFDSKISEHTFPQLDSEVGLRHLVATEFIAADKKSYGELSPSYKPRVGVSKIPFMR